MALFLPRAVSQDMISHTMLILTLTIGSVVSIFIESRYLAVSEVANITGNDDLFEDFLNKSLITCAVMCQEKCACFGHHVHDGRCRLREQCIHASEEGWQYFRKVQEHTDCQTLYSEGGIRLSGVYTIRPQGRGAHPVYCDMSTEGGGWTVILKRMKGFLDFSGDWEEYKNGFGESSDEHWIGNELIHLLTSQSPSRLYVMIKHVNGTTFYQIYDVFSVSGEENGYRLSIGETSGTLGDSMIPHVDSSLNLNGMMFSTADRDQDGSYSNNCASLNEGGWWFNACHYVFLTGPFGSPGWIKPWYPAFTYGDKVQSVIMMTKRK